MKYIVWYRRTRYDPWTKLGQVETLREAIGLIHGNGTFWIDDSEGGMRDAN
jgi:hypothetical protein